MKKHTSTEAILLLEDGTIFKGKSLGRIGISGGELCFNTGMTGYQEIFTDPSYYGQIIVTTASHIGNYGVQHQEVESDTVQIKGLVCKEFSHNYSRNIIIRARNISKYSITGQICVLMVNSSLMVRQSRSTVNELVSAA